MTFSKFTTKYSHNGGTFLSYVMARNTEEALEILERRGLGEVIDNQMEEDQTVPLFIIPPMATATRILSLIETISFHAWICIRQNRIDKVSKIIGPQGVLGQLIHIVREMALRDTFEAVIPNQLIKDTYTLMREFPESYVVAVPVTL